MRIAALLAILIAFIALFTILGLLTLRQARRAWQRYRDAKTHPLIANLSVDQLDHLQEEWPLNQDRWPIPRTPEIAADPVVAAAYARVARHTEQNLIYTAEVLAIVGGAWLGTSLLTLWQNLAALPHRAIALAPEDSDPIGTLKVMLLVYSDADLWLSLLPIIPITVGIKLRAGANRYADARAVYDAAATSRLLPATDRPPTPSERASNPTEQTSPPALPQTQPRRRKVVTRPALSPMIRRPPKRAAHHACLTGPAGRHRPPGRRPAERTSSVTLAGVDVSG